MKKKLQQCSKCGEETWHMVGKKQAHNGDTHYTRRSTVECMKCGKKEISNKTKGKRIRAGRNDALQKKAEVADE